MLHEVLPTRAFSTMYAVSPEESVQARPTVVVERGVAARSAGDMIDGNNFSANGMNLIRLDRRNRTFSGFKDVIAREILEQIAEFQQADPAQGFDVGGAEIG